MYPGGEGVGIDVDLRDRFTECTSTHVYRRSSIDGTRFACKTLEFDQLRSRTMYKQFSNLAPRLSAQKLQILKFSLASIPKRDLNTKKTPPGIERSHVILICRDLVINFHARFRL